METKGARGSQREKIWDGLGSVETKRARGSQREKICDGLGGWISGDKGSERQSERKDLGRARKMDQWRQMEREVVREKRSGTG